MSFLIKYGGDLYVCKGDVFVQPITEFNTAIRLGAASNDDRNLASFVSKEDGRGGIGTVFGTTREDPDKLADSDGVILFKMNQAIKPPLMRTAELDGLDPAASTRAVFYEPSGFEQMMLGFGEKVYFNDVTGEVVTWAENGLAPYAPGEVITQMQGYTDPEDGQYRIFIVGMEGDGSDALSLHYIDDPEDATSTEVAADRTGEMLFEWDGKLFLGGPGTLHWSIRPAESSEWVQMDAEGAWPRRWKFIGAFPFGDTILPYVLVDHHDPDIARIAALDLETNRVIPITMGLGGISDAFAHQGKICIIHDHYRDATLYDPRSGAQLPIDWRAQTRDGFTFDRDALALSGVSHARGPFFFGSHINIDRGQLFLFKGTGWLPYGRAVEGTPIAGGYYSVREQRFYMPIAIDGETYLHTGYINWWSEAYVPGGDQAVAIETEDMSFITPWEDMGFSEIDGALLTLSHGGYADASNRVRVDYQLDFDTSEWTVLGTFPNSTPGEAEIRGRSRPVQNARTALFNALSGVQFTRVRFRITLISLNSMQSPNAYPLTVRFFKRPDMRDSIRIDILVDDTIAQREDLISPDQLVEELKDKYNQKAVPELEAGSLHTWAAMIAYPRVLQIDPEQGEDDVTPSTVSKDAIIVLNVAELV